MGVKAVWLLRYCRKLLYCEVATYIANHCFHFSMKIVSLIPGGDAVIFSSSFRKGLILTALHIIFEKRILISTVGYKIFVKKAPLRCLAVNISCLNSKVRSTFFLWKEVPEYAHSNSLSASYNFTSYGMWELIPVMSFRGVKRCTWKRRRDGALRLLIWVDKSQISDAPPILHTHLPVKTVQWAYDQGNHSILNQPSIVS